MFFHILVYILLAPSVLALLSRPRPSYSKSWTKLRQDARTVLGLSTTSLDEEDNATSTSTTDKVNELKADLVRRCTASPKPSLGTIRGVIADLEDLNIVDNRLLSGQWELIYAPDDETRSSPFFWAFRKAFPDSADQIFGITDAIPAPIKEVGPAFQEIDLNAGKFVSRVKVATLGGFATSMMTTRASILNDDVTNLRLKIETTKPEESSAVEKLLGDFGKLVNENAPAFPSGQALERARPGSSEVLLQNTFVDEGLRISRNAARPDQDVFVWTRKGFATEDL